jgi:hypothetical protein
MNDNNVSREIVPGTPDDGTVWIVEGSPSTGYCLIQMEVCSHYGPFEQSWQAVAEAHAMYARTGFAA